MFKYLQTLKYSTILLCSLLLPATVFADITSLTEPSLDDDIDKKLQQLNEQLKSNKKDAALFISRGDIYFRIRDFQNAVDDYTSAIELAPESYDAYFGRGLANGRMGFIQNGINDLSVYIKQYPNSSVAYTKRGVRYLWFGDTKNAQSDFEKAIKLNPDNAEAHDDLGVIFAQKKKYDEALMHFNLTVKLDPSYQKGFHNLAMTHYLTGQDIVALQNVNIALQLSPTARNSILLKSEILKVMGRIEEANKLQEDALFLPEGNWHEQAPVQ